MTVPGQGAPSASTLLDMPCSAVQRFGRHGRFVVRLDRRRKTVDGEWDSHLPGCAVGKGLPPERHGLQACGAQPDLAHSPRKPGRISSPCDRCVTIRRLPVIHRSGSSWTNRPAAPTCPDGWRAYRCACRHAGCGRKSSRSVSPPAIVAKGFCSIGRAAPAAKPARRSASTCRLFNRTRRNSGFTAVAKRCCKRQSGCQR